MERTAADGNVDKISLLKLILGFLGRTDIFRHHSLCNVSYVRPTNRAGRSIRARCLMRVLPSGKTRAGGNAIMSFKHR